MGPNTPAGRALATALLLLCALRVPALREQRERAGAAAERRRRPLDKLIEGRNGTASLVVLFAGVEGAGHHFMSAMQNRMPQEFYRHLGIGGCESYFDRESATAEISQLVKGLLPGQVGFLKPDAVYPCGLKSRSNPQIALIAEAVQAGGGELEVIFLQRSFAECLSMGCLKLEMQDCAGEADTLRNSGLELARQLEAFPASSVHCLPYGTPADRARVYRNAFGEDGVYHRLKEQVYNLDPEVQAHVQEMSETEERLATFCENRPSLSMEDVMG